MERPTRPMQPNPSFVVLPKLTQGDKVGIISPSAGLVSVFPHVYEQGIRRLREQFELEPVEYALTRHSNAPLKERAKHIEEAFSDPATKAVISVIGGSDQIRLIEYLDPKAFTSNPKAFFGYSDNTHLCNFRWRLGLPSYYGGSVLVQFAFQNEIPELTARFLRAAMFERGRFALEASTAFAEEELPWSEPENLAKPRNFSKNEGWHWNGSEKGEGRLWGGCLESLVFELAVNRWLPTPADLHGCILCLETSEEIPTPYTVSTLLVGLGERGYLSQLNGLLVGRAKAYYLNGIQNSVEQRKRYRDEQRTVIESTFRDFNKHAPIVTSLDFGHTDPQIPMPMGNMAYIDPIAGTVEVEY